ncbi:MAG: tail fiber domain-containing protein [Bacteroidota bacterium]
MVSFVDFNNRLERNANFGIGTISGGFNNSHFGYRSGLGGGDDNATFGHFAGGFLSQGSQNSFFGSLAGSSIIESNLNQSRDSLIPQGVPIGFGHSFFGYGAGQTSAGGGLNSFFGSQSGFNNSGFDNAFFGSFSGINNQMFRNTLIGHQAGFHNELGVGNVFLGQQAGLQELGSHKLYIANDSTNTPLIYGDFEAQTATVNGFLGVGIQNPERPIHLRSEQAIFRIDRDRKDPGFAIVRYFQGFQDVMKSFYFYTLGQNANNGKFIIADWGRNVSGPDHTARLVIANNGNIGVGDYLLEDPSEKLTVDGNVLALGYLTSSDKRLKKDIQPIPGALESLEDLEGISFSYQQATGLKKDLPRGRQFGLIAQQVQKVYPALVHESKNGMLAIYYDGFIPILMEALKTQQSQLTKMDKQVDQLLHSLEDPANEEQSGTLYKMKSDPNESSLTIPFALPQDYGSAQMMILDLQGKLIKSYPIAQPGKGELTFDSQSLEAGIYQYQLLMDDKIVDAKRMLVE